MRKIFESGRSLLETISVLAVIAVLLVAGLLGFKGVMDYFRHKETAKLIASLGAKNLLQPARNRSMGGGKEGIRIKDLCPTCDECNENNSFCVNGADGSQITMHADSEDNTSFWVVVKGAHPQSCREALLMGGYGLAIGGKNLNLDTGSEIASVDMKTAEFLRGHESNVEDTIRDFCCDNSDDPDDQLGKDCVQYLLYSKSACKNYYDGTCHDCKKGWVLAPSGKKGSIDGCCLEGEVECGVCGGCVGKCVNGSCAECETNDDCTEKCDDEAGKVCNRYCVNGMCKPCQRVGDICYDKNGNPATGDCECNGCTAPKVFVEESSSCECPTTPLIQGNACDEDCPCSTGYVCETRDSDTNSKCYCPETKPTKDEDCNLDCGCGTNDAGKQLYCIAGKCQLDACETDDDCADNTDGRTSCETDGENAGKCVCDKDKLEDDGTGKCRCKGDTGNTKEWFRYGNSPNYSYRCCSKGSEHLSEKDSNYVCCPNEYELMEVGGEYKCWSCCAEGYNAALAIILDFSYSSIHNESERLHSSGKTYREFIDDYSSQLLNVPSDILKGSFREDNTHDPDTGKVCCSAYSYTDAEHQSCTVMGNSASTTISGISSATPTLTGQPVCASDCGSGTTCFRSAVDTIKSWISGHTNTQVFSVLFADGAINLRKVSGTDNYFTGLRDISNPNAPKNIYALTPSTDLGLGTGETMDINTSVPTADAMYSMLSTHTCTTQCTYDEATETGTQTTPAWSARQYPPESET